jgi:hypothetical protein
MPSVVQDWVHELTMQQQTLVLLGLTSVPNMQSRNCTGVVELAYRACVLKSPYYGRRLHSGERCASGLLEIDTLIHAEAWSSVVRGFKQEINGLYTGSLRRLMGGVEILAHNHPDIPHKHLYPSLFRDRWAELYKVYCVLLHVQPVIKLMLDEETSDWHQQHWDTPA